MSSALIVVPPLIKYSSGPLLGPAMLCGAASKHGHQCEVIDLNIQYLNRNSEKLYRSKSLVKGDHDKPRKTLSELQSRFEECIKSNVPSSVREFDTKSSISSLQVSHDAIESTAKALSKDPLVDQFMGLLVGKSPPQLCGFSVMYSGQILIALALSIRIRALWPNTLIVWGGAHVTALREDIAVDKRFGRFIDGFFFGYAEKSFVDFLDYLDGHGRLPSAFTKAGQGSFEKASDDSSVVPEFRNLDLYGFPELTLPAQASRGCSYGRCKFCTYPAVEGEFRNISLAGLESVVTLAQQHNAVVSLKDSLVTPKSMIEIAKSINSRVKWSACTKLHKRFDLGFFEWLKSMGCSTLEFGLETLVEEASELIDKRQSLGLFLSVLNAARSVGMPLVINYMTGLPNTDRSVELSHLNRVRNELSNLGDSHFWLEHNEFELEKLAPFAKTPTKYGIEITGRWPWSSILAWRSLAFKV